MLLTSALVWSMPPRLMRTLSMTRDAWLSRVGTQNLPSTVRSHQERMKGFVDVIGRVYSDPFRTLLPVSAFAQFEGCHDGDALGWPDAFEAGEIVDFPFAQPVQVVVAAGKCPLHQCHGTFFSVSRADKDCQQFGVAEGFRSFQHHFFPWPVFCRPPVDCQFFHLFSLPVAGTYSLLFIEILLECLKLILATYATVPPGTPETGSVSDELDEGGGNGIDTDAQALVP